jgi:uncharacterized membrane protein YfcA
MRVGAAGPRKLSPTTWENRKNADGTPVSATLFGMIALAVAAAAFVQGTMGMGFALIVAPVLGLLAPGLLPVCLLVLMIPLNVYVAWRERSALDLAGASWITAGRFAGTFGGVWVLAALSAHDLNLLVGAATLLAALATLFAPSFRPAPQACLAAGLVTGVMETATGIGGPPLALVYQHQSPPTVRSTIAFCFLVGELISLAFLVAAGRASAPQFASAAIFLPALAVGAILSQRLHRRVGGPRLRNFVLLFAAASGVVLLMRG